MYPFGFFQQSSMRSSSWAEWWDRLWILSPIRLMFTDSSLWLDIHVKTLCWCPLPLLLVFLRELALMCSQIRKVSEWRTPPSPTHTQGECTHTQGECVIQKCLKNIVKEWPPLIKTKARQQNSPWIACTWCVSIFLEFISVVE